MRINSPYITGSAIITGNLCVQGTITGTITGVASTASYAETLDGLDSTQFVQTGSFNSYTSSASSSLGDLSGSVATTTNTLSSSVSSSIGSLSGSVATTTLDLSSSIGSLSGSVATTTSGLSSSIGDLSSSVATTTSGLGGRITTIEGNYATTGSNTFVGSQVITGSLYITTDLIVQGSSSLQNITASAVSIGTNTVILNTDTPAVRFAGISVQDSGSNAGVTGSIFWDGLCNRWVYSNPSGIGYSGGMLLSGPRTSTLGTESPLTCNVIAKSGGGDHLYDSCIIDDGTTVCVNANLKGSGTACFGSTITASSVSLGAGGSVDNLSNINYGGYTWGSYNTSNGTITFSNVTGCGIKFATGEACFASAINSPGGTISQDLRIYRSGGTTTGYINFGSTGTNYFGFDGTKYVANGVLSSTTGLFSGQVCADGAVLSANLSGTNANFSSYVSVGSLVVNDPGAAYYCYTNRIGGSTAINVNSLNVTTELGKFLSSGLSINSGGGATNNMYQISFGYKDASGVYASSAIAGIAESSTGYNTGAIIFATRSATTDTAPVERLRISSSGAATFTCSLTAESGYFNKPFATNGTSLVVRQTTAGGNGNQDIGLVVDIQGANDLDRILNLRYYNGSSYTSRFSVLRDGKVGIGISVPLSPLHIQTSEPTLRITDSDDSGVMFIGNSGGYSYIRPFSRDFKFLNAAGSSMLTIASNGAATFSSSITTSGNITVNSDGIVVNRSTSGEAYIFFRKDGVNRASIYGVTGGGLRVFDESDNQVLTMTGAKLGISETNPSHKLDVNGTTRIQDTTMLGSNVGLLQMAMDGARWNSYPNTVLHIKTSILKGSDTMIAFNIRGYMYSPNTVDTDVAFYNYNPTSSPYGVTIHHKAYSGWSIGLYYSSDNYVCIYVDGMSTYGGFALNWINTSLIQWGGRVFALASTKVNTTAAQY